MDIGETQGLWNAEPGWLNTAGYGLPPRPAWDALQEAMADWRAGATLSAAWDEAPETARAGFARLLGVSAGDIAVGSQASQLLAPVASAVADGARVVVPEIEFTSNLFPWLVHGDRLKVTTVPVDRLVETVAAGCDVVAFSLVQSSTGEIAAYEKIVAAARDAGAMVVVDASQACGWLPFDVTLADVVVVSAYKWLMCARGAAFAYLSPRVRDAIRPIAAGWFAGADKHSSYYGPAMHLAPDARRFDVSPAWFSWIGAPPALAVVERLGIPAIHDHNVALANRFLAGLGRPAGDSAIVTVEAGEAGPRLAAAGIRMAMRAGRLRASFHIYTTEADVDRALTALTG
jgi:selenocysteine lyase/cysteine desulfurase